MSERAKREMYQRFDRWGFDVKGWGRNTRAKYFREARAADAWLTLHRGTSILFATPKDLQAFLFSKPANARTRNNTRQALVAICDFLMAEGMAGSNAAKGLPRLPEPECTPKALAPEEVRRVEIAAMTFDPMDRALLLIYIVGGLRKTEARMLERTNLTPDGWLRFAGKRDRVRYVPLDDIAIDALRSWLAENPDPRWCFPSPRMNGQPVSDTYVRHLVYELGDIAGIPRLHPHILRHSAATEMLEATDDIRTVQMFLGHASLATTQIYAKVRPVRLRDAVKRVRDRRRKREE